MPWPSVLQGLITVWHLVSAIPGHKAVCDLGEGSLLARAAKGKVLFYWVEKVP